MSKKFFTRRRRSENKYVKSVSIKGFTYTDEFKNITIFNISNSFLAISSIY